MALRQLAQHGRDRVGEVIGLRTRDSQTCHICVVRWVLSDNLEHLELGLEDGQLVCSVTDTGIGIAPDDQEQILDEFYRVDSSPDSRHRGAGLGLTLARGLIEKLGGSLSLQSEIGQGSRFSFALPVTIC